MSDFTQSPGYIQTTGGKKVSKERTIFSNPLTGSSFNAPTGDWSNSMTNAYNFWLWQQANAQEIQNWQMKNEYDAPLEQMKRFQQAGLNPNLIYGQQSVSGAQAPVGSAPAAKPSNIEMQNRLNSLNQANQVLGQIMGLIRGAKEIYDYATYGSTEHSLQNSLLLSQGNSARDNVDMNRIKMAFQLSRMTNGPITMTSQDGHQFTINYNDTLEALEKIASVNNKNADTSNKEYFREHIYPFQSQYWNSRAMIENYNAKAKKQAQDVYNNMIKSTNITNPFVQMLLWKAFQGFVSFDLNDFSSLASIAGKMF